MRSPCYAGSSVTATTPEAQGETPPEHPARALRPHGVFLCASQGEMAGVGLKIRAPAANRLGDRCLPWQRGWAVEHSDWRLNGKRMSFLGWVCTLAVIAVCGALFHRVVYADWQKNGLPNWVVRYERWEKRVVYDLKIRYFR